jgi:hypothetical protein
MTADVTTLKLWAVLEQKGDDSQRALVKSLARDAGAILDRVIETFPTYTLHNSTHARNVAELMAELLGPTLLHLSALEAAMLILSAFWHDAGMVFIDTERTTLGSEPSWRAFLTDNPEAEVALEGAGELPTDIAEWYCRWRHADRVYVYLDNLSPGRLQWGRINIREALGELCRSHNLDVAEIKNNHVLQINYLEAADLKFCAILLRLADILDFDNSRSPDAVYRMLGLARRKDKRAARSDVEWLKHLDSEGFRFPERRDAPYPLGFIAGPSHPAVEHDVRKFLDVIENELDKCAGLLPCLAARWSGFILPGKISRENIKSNGYHYGEYRFLLDQTQVLNLLMGENLYEDRHVFVRELLQNAIDTSRYREFSERVQGKALYRSKPIRVSEWRDTEGRLWIRFDDSGMGMDESIILNHLLRVGSSYYQTAKFRADVMRARKSGAPDFVPISRFGIGLLSCFIIADRVEISTRHHGTEGKTADPVRLSLDGLHGFFTLQTGRDQPSPMPGEDGDEPGYRWETGTSIAVRLDPRKEGATFQLRSLLGEHVFSSPVPIELDGQPVGHDYASMIEKPWCEPTVVDFLPEAMAQLCEFTGFGFTEPLKVAFIPLDLTRHSSTPEFKGQILTAVIQPTAEWRGFQKRIEILGHITLRMDFKSHASKSSSSRDIDHKVLAIRFSLFTHDYADRMDYVRHLRDNSLGGPDDVFAEAVTRLIERIEAARASDYHFPVQFSEKLSTRGAQEKPLRRAEAWCGVNAVRVSESLPGVAQDNILSIDTNKRPSICHNGVVIPPKSMRRASASYQASPLNPSFVHHGALSYQALSWGAIALSDSLRPDVDVSRGSLRRVPLSVYSSAILSLHGSLREAGLEEDSREDVPGFTHVIDTEPPNFGQLIDEKILLPAAVWADVPLFFTDLGMLSLREVQELLASDSPVRFLLLPDGWPQDPRERRVTGSYLNSFSRICAGALAQLELNLEIRFREKELEGFFAVPGKSQGIQPGQRFFPPLTFLSYNNDVFVRVGCGVNLKHPLSRWLIGIIPSLAEQYPGILNQLRTVLLQVVHRELFSVDFGPWDRDGFRAAINTILERMMNLKREFRPPKSLVLVEDDVLEAFVRQPDRDDKDAESPAAAV